MRQIYHHTHLNLYRFNQLMVLIPDTVNYTNRSGTNLSKRQALKALNLQNPSK